MLLFETSAGNGKLVKAFAGLGQPVGNSLMYEVYKLLPNDTDLTAFKRAGVAGMNFAAMERTTTPVPAASMQGRAMLTEIRENWSMTAHGLPAEGAELEFAVALGRPLALRLIDRSHGLPSVVPARPGTMIAQPFDTSDSMRAVRSLAFQ